MLKNIEQDQIKTEAETFYKEALQLLSEHEVPFLIGGGIALKLYTDINRDTKDLDIFCKTGDCPRIVKIFSDNGYDTEMLDARWLAKAKKGDRFVDVIFNNPSNHCPVDDSWFERSVAGELYGIPMQFISPEELIRCKIYVQNRERHDSADINHTLLRVGDKLDWKRIWTHLEQHWQLLLAQLLNFQFVYPSDRDLVPRWLMDELLLRAKEQYDMEPTAEKICRGPLIDQTQYATDITEWDYKVVTMRSV